MNKTVGVVLAIIVIAAVGVFAVSTVTNKKASQSTPAVAGQQTTPSPVPSVTISTPSASQEFTVTGSNFSFTPKEIKVKKGDTVKITFKNANGFHDFKIDEFNVATQRVAAGSEETVTFVADKTGTFQYYCSVGNHRAEGMWGNLIVE